jgi:DNA ligase-1
MTKLQLPTLYKRTVTGAIQEWTIYAEDGKHWSISGQIDGKKVTAAPSICQSKNVGRKNETTAIEQAELEAKAKWQKKIDEGYSESIENIDKVREIRVEPMLAKDYKDHKNKLKFPLYSQPKLDGLRCIITSDAAMSRKWKPFVTLDHVREALQPLFKKYPNIVAFDGEMYSHDLKDQFEEIVSIVKQPKATSDDIEKAKRYVQYHIYDYVDTESISFADRTERLQRYLSEITSEYITTVKTSLVESEQELYDVYLEYIVLGYEGQMVRSASAPYQHKRTDSLLKRKDFIDEEFKIVGYKEGNGSRQGCVVLRCLTAEGKEFDSVPKGGVEYLQRIWQRREELVNLTATIKFQCWSKDGIPRFNNTIKFRNNDLEEVVF